MSLEVVKTKCRIETYIK